MADAALLRVFSVVRPFAGGGSSTPARRALLRPMAMACFVERAPCLPSRMWWISSRTNSPACVVGDFPSRLSCRALSMVFFSGMALLLSNAGASGASRQVAQEPVRRQARDLLQLAALLEQV